MTELMNESTSENSMHLLENDNRATVGIKYIVVYYFIICCESTAISYTYEVNISKTLTYCLTSFLSKCLSKTVAIGRITKHPLVWEQF